MEDIFKFEATPTRCLYNTPDFKIYGMRVDIEKYPLIQINQYGTVTLTGNYQELEIGLEYFVTAEEVMDKKYGITYKARNISLHKPDNMESCRTFLETVLTYSQAQSLLKVYPNIVQKVIDNDLDDIDLSQLHNIGEYRFNVIKRKIVENFVIYDLVEEFKGTLDFNILFKLYQKYNSIDKLKEELNKDIYGCLTDISRVGFLTADKIVKNLYESANKIKANGDNPPIDLGDNFLESKGRCRACMIYCLEDNQDKGNTCMPIKELAKQVSNLAYECVRNFVDIIYNEDCLYFDKTAQTVSLTKTYLDELYIATTINKALEIDNKWECNFEKYQHDQDGYELTSEQLSILPMVCENNVVILSGSAGVGKTTSTIAVVNMLKDLDKSYLLISPTGKAAKNLSEYTKEQASTIHRGLGYTPDGWTYNLKNKLNVDMVILDETSMCDLDLFTRLIEAIDFNKTKLLLVGDPNQLPSVGCGNIYYDLINSHKIKLVNLTKIFRYGEGGIYKVATDIKDCKQYLFGNKSITMGTSKDYSFIQCQAEETVFKASSLYNALIKRGYNTNDIMVLSCMNKGGIGTDAINIELQKVANKNATKDNKEFIEYGGTKYYVGDTIIQVVNNYKALEIESYRETFIANGETGQITRIINNVAYVKFGDITVMYTKENFSMVKLGYCISYHRSQGSGFKIVIVLSPKAHTYMLNSNLLYVGITRAKKMVFHIVDAYTINNAIKKKEDWKRNTELIMLLKELPNDYNELLRSRENNEFNNGISQNEVDNYAQNDFSIAHTHDKIAKDSTYIGENTDTVKPMFDLSVYDEDLPF